MPQDSLACLASLMLVQQSVHGRSYLHCCLHDLPVLAGTPEPLLRPSRHLGGSPAQLPISSIDAPGQLLKCCIQVAVCLVSPRNTPATQDLCSRPVSTWHAWVTATGRRLLCSWPPHAALPCRSTWQSTPLLSALVALRAPSTQSLLHSWLIIRSAGAPPGELTSSKPPLQVCLATNPIWVIKTRLQLQRRATAAAAAATTGPQAAAAQRAAAMPAYRGLVDAARQIARQEGLLGFYKGLVPSLLLVRQKHSYFAACMATTIRMCLPSPCWDNARHCIQAELAHKATTIASVLTGCGLEGLSVCMQKALAHRKL